MKKEKVFVYILKMERNNFYTGITNNLVRRLREHKKGKRGYTSRFDNKEYLLIYECDSRSQARKIEVLIKRTGVKRFLIKCEKSITKDKRLKLYNKRLLTDNKNYSNVVSTSNETFSY